MFLELNFAARAGNTILPEPQTFRLHKNMQARKTFQWLHLFERGPLQGNTRALLKVESGGVGVGVGGVFEGGKCTCPLATCEKLYREASSPPLVFIKCVKAKRLLNGNALKQIDHTGSNCPATESQQRTDLNYPLPISEQ